ncbi:signal peptidase II [Paenibacillus agricola]|uniref:Lipoprotein signal peptidase n=1 Tax=Paenibacillus agricola TaxID=2716264 RepID=A0ABX0JH70_9BACL|nr:signal peptidase II [Paenibacillus agricola]NHN33191.1 signal peptidase II [Paenibacillus agricola]
MTRYYVIAAAVFLLDQFIKGSVVRYMELGQSIPLIKGIFHLTSHRNRGAAFGILQNQRLFFIVVTIAILIGIILYLRKVYKSQPFLSVALAMVMGGALGNFVDRAIKGEVVDMFEFKFINYPIFNMADALIVTGFTMIILDNIRKWRQEKNTSIL